MFLRLVPFLFLLFGLTGAHVLRRHCPTYISNDATNICNDPLSGQPPLHSDESAQSLIDPESVPNLISNTLEILNNLTGEFAFYWSAAREFYQAPENPRWLHILYCYPSACRNNVTIMYANISEAVHIFKILTRPGMDVCAPFEDVHLHRKLRYLYNRLKNTVQANLYYIYRSYGTPLEGKSCHVKTWMRPFHALSCDEIRNLVFVIFRHTIRKLRVSVEVLGELNRSLENIES